MAVMEETKTYKVTFTATFTAVITVEPGEKPEDVAADIEIPEGGANEAEYKADTFDIKSIREIP